MPHNSNMKPSVANRRKFCGSSCAASYRHAKRIEAGIPAPSGWTRDSYPRPFILERAVAKYKANPKICKGCGEPMPLPPSGRPCDLDGRVYCTAECSLRQKKETFDQTKTTQFWPIDKLPPTMKVTELPFRPKKDVQAQEIRKNAKKVYRTFSRERVCEFCGKALGYPPDVAHIAPLASFSPDTLILEINQLSNLIGLCPSDHKDFDHGIISLEQIKEKVAARKPRP